MPLRYHHDCHRPAHSSMIVNLWCGTVQLPRQLTSLDPYPALSADPPGMPEALPWCATKRPPDLLLRTTCNLSMMYPKGA